MAKKVTNIDVRRIGKGFITRTSTEEKMKDENGREYMNWDSEEEIFLEKEKLQKAITVQINKL